MDFFQKRKINWNYTRKEFPKKLNFLLKKLNKFLPQKNAYNP
jgi:hypothetical protein